jgi:hypothetical protein
MSSIFIASVMFALTKKASESKLRLVPKMEVQKGSTISRIQIFELPREWRLLLAFLFLSLCNVLLTHLLYQQLGNFPMMVAVSLFFLFHF